VTVSWLYFLTNQSLSFFIRFDSYQSTIKNSVIALLSLTHISGFFLICFMFWMPANFNVSLCPSAIRLLVVINYTDIQPKTSIDEISLLWLFCGCWTLILKIVV
jgi:hypothetical protein